MVAPASASSFLKRLVGYLGLCLFEALLAAVLTYVSFLVLWPRANGGGSGAYACAVIAFFFLAPVFWAACVMACLAAKVVVVLMPPSHRHWSLAVYWGVTAGCVAWHLVSESHRPPPFNPLPLASTVLSYAMYSIPALILTFSHFVLLPRFAPGSSVRSIFALLRRAPAQAPSAELPPKEPGA